MKTWLAVLLWSWLLTVQAGEVMLTGDERQLVLTPWLEMREDPSASLTAAQLAAEDFRAARPGDINVGYSASAFWYRTTLTNRGQTPRTYWLEAGDPRLRDVSLHLWQQGRWSVMQGGTGKPFSVRQVAAPASMFPVKLAPGESVQAYVRFASPTVLLTAITLWEPDAYLRSAMLEHLIDGILFGGFLLAFGYSIVIAISVREPSFLYLGVAALFYVILQVALRGYGPMYLWPEAPWWTPVAIAPGMMIAAALAIVYQRSLLQSAVLTPRGDRCLLACCWIMVLLAPASIFIDYRIAVRIFNLLLAAALVGLAVIAVLGYIRKVQAVRTYVLAVLALVVTYAPLVSHLEGQVIHPVLVKRVPAIGSLLMVMLWTYALHFQFNQLRRQRAQAQDELLTSRAGEQARLERTVTERTGQLQVALGQANAANQAKSSLLAHISHDLRAPLSTIIGYARQWRQKAADQSVPQAIERNARNQLTLIDDLLEYACIDLHEAELRPHTGNLPDFLNEVGDDAHQLAGNAGLSFALILDPALPDQVQADFKRLRQVLMNLLSNGAKFTASGGIILRVNTAPAGRILFEVIDTGPGLSGEECARIFEPFESGSTRARLTGVGLGLAISRHYVEKMGGALDVDSTPGQGSRFHFGLTLA